MTLVASLLTMGISTVVIGLLPGYATIGIFAPLLLALARFGRVWVSAENGAARHCWRPKTPRRASALYGSFRSLARLSASSSPTARSCSSPGC